MKKVTRDGKVAVLYSPGFGAGWSTWADADQRETLCMDADIVQPVIDGDIKAAIKAAVAKFPDLYTGGAKDLQVAWIKAGTVFEVEEYDGSESIHEIGSRTYHIA